MTIRIFSKIQLFKNGIFHGKGHHRFVTKLPYESLLRTSNRALSHSQVPMEDVIDMNYRQNHSPIGYSRKYGPPYTDVKALETIPLDVYLFQIPPKTSAEKFAFNMVLFFKKLNHLFFRDKYGHHAVVLETVAAVPGMIAGMMRHMRSLRTMQRDHGWIGKLLEEAENERMHLLTWMQLFKPTFVERIFVIGAQCFYTPFYAVLYAISPKTAHRFVGYLEEEACHAYTDFLNAIDKGQIKNVPAPEIAIKYWNLPPDSTLRDVVLVVRADECLHKNVNHEFSEKSREGLY